MGIWDKLRGELIDIIEWLDDSRDTMVYRFDRYGNEIKYGAQLVVRESQAAVFIDEGRLADIFEPGTYTLNTANLPVLTTLKGWKYGFESPFKAEVYFINTRRFTDLKWGTKNPVMLRDPEFGPVRIRMFGTYCIRINDPEKFLKEIVGTDGHFTTEEVTEQLRNLIVSRASDRVAESRIPVLDMAASYDELGEFITQRIHPDFTDYGLDVTRMLVENISLPPAVEEALDKRTGMGIVGNLQSFMQYQSANAMEAAAKNPGGDASSGIGMGMGFAMANQMGKNVLSQEPENNTGQSASPGMPPPIPQGKTFFTAVNGQQEGPYAIDALKAQVISGQLTRETLVWSQGMEQWTAAGQVPELNEVFSQVPPPLPPNS